MGNVRPTCAASLVLGALAQLQAAVAGAEENFDTAEEVLEEIVVTATRQTRPLRDFAFHQCPLQ